MSPDLKATIAQVIVLLMAGPQNPDTVHELLLAIAEQAWNEGKMAGLDRAKELMDKHLGAIA